MTAGDAYSRSLTPRDVVVAEGSPSWGRDRDAQLVTYVRFIRTIAPVACLAGYAGVVVATDVDPPTRLAAWLVAAYVVGVAYELLVVGARLPRIPLLRASLFIDTVLVAGVTSTFAVPEALHASYLWPMLVAAYFLTARDVVVVATAAAACSVVVPAVVGSNVSTLVVWSGPVVLGLLGAILAFVTTQSRTTERELAGERAVEDVVLAFTERIRIGVRLDDALRLLEVDIRHRLGPVHAAIDLARADRSRRTPPGGIVVPVRWDGEEVARISASQAGGRPVDPELAGRLERVATFVGAVIGQFDAIERREDADDRLREADRLKDTFLAMASHELRTPLTSIRGFTETMSRQWDVLADEDKQRFLSIVVSQSERLARLVDDLMLLSGIQAGNLAVSPVPVRVGDAVDRVVRTHGIGDVRMECARGVCVHAEPDHVDQMLRNFVDNAVAYGSAPIVVTCDEVGDDVTISVTDAGPGVSEEFEPRLFGEFQRDHGSTGLPGAGLGLSIVRTLARAYGGDAWHEPVEPTGARFVVRLPAAPATSH